MANVVTIAKANGTAIAMEKVTGVYPELDIQKDYVRLYYSADKLPEVQRSFERMLQSSKPSDIRMELQPVIQPVLIKKYWYYPAAALAVAFLIGRITKRK